MCLLPVGVHILPVRYELVEIEVIVVLVWCVGGVMVWWFGGLLGWSRGGVVVVWLGGVAV